MKLQRILGRGRYFRKIRGTNHRDWRITMLSTIAQAVLHITESNSQGSSLGLQFLIILSESIMVLLQLVDVKAMAI